MAIEKISRETPDLTQENIEKLLEIFPQVATEVSDNPLGASAPRRVERAIDFDALRELLGDVAERGRERYQFTWPGKREAKAEARRPTRKTMRPCPEKSVDWDTTQNLYIEGDNLEALKIMRETYAGRVKLIYIDPPYNTGHDFVYDDDFARARGDYEAASGDYDAEGGRLVANPESNGRFHSDWCSMMYPRLLLARDLLTDDGAIFISIDDNEAKNLRAICDEVFGANNFLAQITWEKRYTRSNNSKLFASLTDWILAYRKSPSLSLLRESRSEKTDSIYTNPDDDPRGPWTSVSYVNPATKAQRPNLSYALKNPITGEEVVHPTNAWKYERATYEKHVSEGRLYWGLNGNNTYPRLKKFLSEMDGAVPANLWSYKEVGSTDAATKEVSNLLGGKFFDFPKPTGLIEKILDIASDRESIVVDFFSGSGTTAHSVFHKNFLDSGNRQFVLIQLPEKTGDRSEAKKGGFETICDLAEERIRRAGAKIRAEVEEANRQLELGVEPKPVPDLGFRVLRVGDSCLQDEYAAPVDYDQAQLDLFANNLAEGVGPLDLLFQVLPAFRIPYSAKIAERELGGKACLEVINGDDRLIACFDEDVDAVALEAIAREKPRYAVFRDASFANDAAVSNLEEVFKTFSPDTIRKVI